MNFKINFSGKGHDYTQDEIDTVVLAMKTAEPYTQGVHLKTFEKRFGEYIGGGHAFAVNNATAALEMAAQLCQFKPGDEVIIPSHTFTSSAYPFAKKGATIVWADIDLHTRVVTAETLAQKITPRTKAIVVVHLYGYAAEMDPICKLAQKNGIMLIEDAAQSMGSSIGGRKTGTFGDIGIFSLHSHKNMTTLGEGGIILVKSPEMAAVIPMMRHNGHCPFDYERGHYWKPAMSNVDFPVLNGEIIWPNNYCLGEVECALGTKLLERIDRMNREKRARALRFIDEMKSFDALEFHRVDSGRHNYHLLVARVTNGRRDDLMNYMANEKGIQCVVQYCPLNRYPLYQKLGFADANCPNADLFFDTMISFPFHHWMSDDKFEYLISATREALEHLM